MLQYGATSARPAIGACIFCFFIQKQRLRTFPCCSPFPQLCVHGANKIRARRSRSSIQVHEDLPDPAAGPLHKLQPGDFVVIRNFTRKNWRHQLWKGLYQVLLTMYTAMKIAERATWVNASHCKKAQKAAQPTRTAHMEDPRPALGIQGMCGLRGTSSCLLMISALIAGPILLWGPAALKGSYSTDNITLAISTCN